MTELAEVDVVESEIAEVAMEESNVGVLESQPPHVNPHDAIAMVQGQLFTDLPQDLYIPPEAMKVLLETFEGPLDLLLYLIKKQNLDILDIPIADITRQYMEYIHLMQGMRFELAAEYLLMAAMLAEIKSRMLLPRPKSDDEEEVDPRAELIRRLQEYERFKKASIDLDELPRLERDVFIAEALEPPVQRIKPLAETTLDELLASFRDVLQRTKLTAHHHVEKEHLSLRERMTQVLSTVQEHHFCEFTQLFTISEGRAGVIVTFCAILELLKQSMIEIVQAESYSPIHVKAVA